MTKPSELLSYCENGAISKPSASLETLKKLLNSSLDVICSIDQDGRFVSVNSAAKDVWGYEPEELSGTYYMDLVVEADRSLTTDAAIRIMSGVNMTNFENRYTCKDGSVKPILWSARWDAAEQLMYCIAKDATEKKQAEEKLVQNENRLRRAYMLAKIAWWEYDVASQIYTSSNEIFAMYGLPIPPNNQTTLDEFLSYVHPDDVPMLYNDLTTLFQNTYSHYEHRIVKPSGEVIYVMHYSEVIRDEAGNPVHLYGTTKEITKSKLYQLEREASERKLQQYSQKLSDTLESINDGFFTLDRNWQVTYWNRIAEIIFKKRKQEILGKNLWEQFKEAIPLKFYSEYHKAVAENKTVKFEEFFPPLNKWIQVNAYPSNEGLSVFFSDITERKKQEKRLEFIAKASSEVLWEREYCGDVVTINGQRFQELFGYELETNEISLSFWDDKIPPEDLKILKENEEYALKNQLEFYINEYRFKKRDQNWAYVRSRIYLLYDNNKTVLSMIGAMEDVTNQRLSQKALFESEKNYRMLFDSAPLPTLISDTETLKYIDVNQAASIHFGYTREEFLNMSIFDLRPKEEHENLFHFMAQLDENDSHHTKKFLLVKKSGELIHTEVSASVIQYKGKKAFFATVKDVTENIKLQEELMQERISQEKSITKTIIDTQEKERSEIGKELHDNVNQILTTIKLYIENIKAYPEHSTAFIEKGVLLTQRAINEIRYLAKQLVTPVMADLGFEATLDELVVHFKALNTFEIDFCFDIEEKQIDKGLQLIIYRIVQEQLNNVVKYARASRVKIHIKKGKRQIHLLIEDNGIGFNPTETNFGLGLRNIKNRAELYRGVVHLRSAKGEGCTLIVDFPWD